MAIYDYTQDAALVTSALDSLSSSIAADNASRRAYSAARENTAETNATNLQIARENNRYNKELYEMQFQNVKDMQAQTEKYNSPQEQVRMLREAGLNPALSFGDVSSLGTPTLPSAAPAQDVQMQQMPGEAFNELAKNPFSGMLNNFLNSMRGFEALKSEQIDNQTKDAYNTAQINKVLSEIDSMLDSSKTSAKQRDLLEQQKIALIYANQMSHDTYADRLAHEQLRTKYMQLQNDTADQAIKLNASRFAIEALAARDSHALTMANIRHINALATSIVNADLRSQDEHSLKMRLAPIEEALKRLNLSEEQKQSVFNDLMREINTVHELNKHNSPINDIVESAFGFGFRDLGNMLKGFIK